MEVMTDNKNRAVAEIRHIFNKYGGNMGENGCVAWMFDNKGYFNVDRAAVDEEKLMEIALEAGADDVAARGAFVRRLPEVLARFAPESAG